MNIGNAALKNLKMKCSFENKSKCTIYATSFLAVAAGHGIEYSTFEATFGMARGLPRNLSNIFVCK